MRICKIFSNFAAVMRKFIVYSILFVFSLAYAHAETIILRTGARVKGEIVFRNADVVVVRDPETGARSQYPSGDVQEILSDEEYLAGDEQAAPSEEPEQIKTMKKASILLELAAGAAVNPNEAAGGAFSVDLLVGSHHIGARHLFIGGGLGYHGLFISGEKYNFLPVQVAIRMPFVEQKHTPVFGAGIGYGIGLSKHYLGGIYADAAFGYRCALNPKTAVSLVAFAQFQQAKLPLVTTIEGVEYTHTSGRNLVATGVKFSLYF